MPSSDPTTYVVEKVFPAKSKNPTWIRALLRDRASFAGSFSVWGGYPTTEVCPGQIYEGRIKTVVKAGRTYSNLSDISHWNQERNTLCFMLHQLYIPVDVVAKWVELTPWPELHRKLTGSSFCLDELNSELKKIDSLKWAPKIMKALRRYQALYAWEPVWKEHFPGLVEKIDQIREERKYRKRRRGKGGCGQQDKLPNPDTLATLMKADMKRVTEWKIPSKRILTLPRYWYRTEDPEEEPPTSVGPIPYQTYADLANLIRELLDISPTSEWQRRLDRANACLEVIRDTKCYWIHCNQISDSQAESLSDEYPDNDPFRRRMHHDTERCSLAKFDSIESELSIYFAQLCQSSWKQPTDLSEEDELLLDSISQSMRIRLSDEQKDAIRTALRSKISVITGGAGSGKSTVLYALYRAISNGSCSDVKACAPTGKASMRLAEIGIDDPSTVHRALYAQGSTSIDVFVLDEQSMQCPEVLARLLAKHKPQKLVFVGDPAQLSSLSPGRLLLDLIEVVPTMHLSVCLRSDDLIKTNACRVRDGGSVDALVTAPDKFEIVPDFCMARLVERYLCMWSCGQDVCVLAPTNKEVVQINTLVYTRLESIRTQRNPHSELERRVLDRLQKEEKAAHGKWRAFQDKRNGNNQKKKKKTTRQSGDSARPTGVFKLGVAWNAYKSDEWKPWTIYTGDRMVNAKNWYKEDGKDAFMNGQLCTVVHAEQQQITLRCDEDTYWICNRKRIRDQIVPCHAITMHKSQGSEYDSVLIWMSYSSPHRTRNMLYTAITRAKSTCVLYSSKSILQKIVDTEEPERFTLLSDRILKQIRACRHAPPYTTRPTCSTLKPRPKRPLPIAYSDPEQGCSKVQKIQALDRFQFQSPAAMK